MLRRLIFLNLAIPFLGAISICAFGIIRQRTEFPALNHKIGYPELFGSIVITYFFSMLGSIFIATPLTAWLSTKHLSNRVYALILIMFGTCSGTLIIMIMGGDAALGAVSGFFNAFFWSFAAIFFGKIAPAGSKQN